MNETLVIDLGMPDDDQANWFLVDENGGIVNDPIILRVAEDRFWASLADSDAGLWMKGIAWGRGLDVAAVGEVRGGAVCGARGGRRGHFGWIYLVTSPLLSPRVGAEGAEPSC